MTFLAIKRCIVFFLVNHIYAGTRCFEQKRRLLNTIGFQIGENTKIVAPVFCTGSLVVGKNCWIGRDFTVHGNGTVIIGNNCDIAPEVAFLTGGHEFGDRERRAGEGQTYTIRIEDGCWIGARTTLLHDITMGKGSVAAACACVAKDVPPDTLVGGVPAGKIRVLYEA